VIRDHFRLHSRHEMRPALAFTSEMRWRSADSHAASVLRRAPSFPPRPWALGISRQGSRRRRAEAKAKAKAKATSGSNRTFCPSFGEINAVEINSSQQALVEGVVSQE
jgi:hypothetical protein